MTGNDLLILSFIFLIILSVSGYFLIDRKIHDIEQSISSLTVFLYTIFFYLFYGYASYNRWCSGR